MRAFDYESSPTAAGATELALSSKRSKFIAGGTTLLDLMKLHVEEPDLIIDVKGLPLASIHETGKAVVIGAMVTNSALAQSAMVKKNFPVLSEAILSGASPQLRNMATVGGNILQRTRCTYFRDPACACNKRQPGTGCSAIDGFNRSHAVLGGSRACIASHPSDMCVALVALEAMIHTLTPGGSARSIPIGEFYRDPGDTPEIKNVLAPGELITAVEIAKRPWLARSVYVKVRDRASYSFALTSVALALDMNPVDRRVRSARIALGGVGTRPWRAPEAETSLQGSEIDVMTIAHAADLALAGARGLRYNDFKIELAKRTLERAFQQIGGVA